MSEPVYLKGTCQHCGEAIEFPAENAGQTAGCPHCGQATTLLATPATENVSDSGAIFEEASVPKSKAPLVWALVTLLILSGGAAAFLARNRSGESRAPGRMSEGTTSTQPKVPTEDTASSNAAPVAATTAKSIEDLRVGPITLEKARGSSLVYATGVLKNESSHQRFGVNLELELTDARGNPAGKAKDYRAVLEPRQEWRFRALVLDSKAVSAKVSAIREEQ